MFDNSVFLRVEGVEVDARQILGMFRPWQHSFEVDSNYGRWSEEASAKDSCFDIGGCSFASFSLGHERENDAVQQRWVCARAACKRS
jgi:hypothetical protein